MEDGPRNACNTHQWLQLGDVAADANTQLSVHVAACASTSFVVRLTREQRRLERPGAAGCEAAAEGSHRRPSHSPCPSGS